MHNALSKNHLLRRQTFYSLDRARRSRLGKKDSVSCAVEEARGAVQNLEVRAVGGRSVGALPGKGEGGHTYGKRGGNNNLAAVHERNP